MKKLLLAFLLTPGLAMANDAVASVSAGGIEFGKTDAIAMKKEVLNVSHALISVDYEFLNESGADVEETIVFPLPAYRAVQDVSDTYYGQPDGFLILVDGKPVPFKTRLVAQLRGDITDKLRALGLTDAQIAYNPSFNDKKSRLSDRQHDQLDKLGFIDEDGPAWEIKVNYVWKQKFPVNKVVRVHHAYRPFVATGPGFAALHPQQVKQYCADAAFLTGWEKAYANSDSFNARGVAYILSTGNTWKNGIEDFTLNLIKQHPSELVSVCFPGKFKRVDAKTLQVRIKNFRPKGELEVLFGNTVDTADPDGVLPVLAR